MKISLKLAALTAVVLLAACASTPQNPFVGAWDVNIESPIGTLPGTFTFAEDGTGTMMIQAPGAPADQPPATFEGATYEDNQVSFEANIDAQGQQMTMSFTGTVEGDELSGDFDTDFGAFPVTGTRQ